jgi:hypothetical protein
VTLLVNTLAILCVVVKHSGFVRQELTRAKLLKVERLQHYGALVSSDGSRRHSIRSKRSLLTSVTTIIVQKALCGLNVARP